MADALSGRSLFLYDRIIAEQNKISNAKEEQTKENFLSGSKEAKDFAMKKFKVVFYFISSEIPYGPGPRAVKMEFRRTHFFENFEKRFWVF